MDRDIGAGPFDRFDEMSTKKVRKIPKPSEKTKIQSQSNSSTEASKESQVEKKSSSGSC